MLAWADVTLEQPGAAHVVFWNDEVEPLRSTASDVDGTHRLPIIGLRAESAYEVQVVAELEDGTLVTSEAANVTTGSLPDDLAPYVPSGLSHDPAAITILGPADPDGEPADSDAPFLFGVDAEGEVVWLHYTSTVGNHANRFAELLEDGLLQLITPQSVRAVDASGDTSWLIATDAAGSTHHDAATLPDGHVVVIAEVTRSIDVPELGGEVDVAGDDLVELDEDGVEVWRWSTFDHLDSQRFPGELSLSEARNGGYDWTHANSLAWVESQGAFLVSLRHQSQVILVDHTSGELLWRLGTDGDFSLEEGSWFASQHAASMPEEDLVLLFDNGNEKENPRSRAVAYRIDPVAGTAVQEWAWDPGVYTSNMGDADRLSSGNTLVCASADRREGADGRLVEVTEDGEEVWELAVTDGDWVYRATRVEWLSQVE